MMPNQNPYGQPQGMYPPQQQMPVPVPFSATLLWLCGVLKFVPTLGCFAGGAMVLAGTSSFVNETGGANGNFLGGLAGLLGSALGVILLVFGCVILFSAIFDTIAGSLARKGRSSGRILGIISAILSLLGVGGSLLSTLLTPSNADNGGAAFIGGVIGMMPFLLINGYILVSFSNNPNAFRN